MGYYICGCEYGTCPVRDVAPDGYCLDEPEDNEDDEYEDDLKETK